MHNAGLVIAGTQIAALWAASGGAPPGAAPAWLPVGATAGVSFVDGEHYFDDTLSSDMTEILGGFDFDPVPITFAYDPTKLTASGLEITAANANRPCAIGALFDKLATNDFAVVFELDLNGSVSPAGFLDQVFGTYADNGSGVWGWNQPDNDLNEWYLDIGFGTTVSNGNGGSYLLSENSFVDPGINRVAVNVDATNGFIFSGNGGTAATDDTTPLPAFAGPNDLIAVGFNWTLSPDVPTQNMTFYPLEGKIRSIIFYPQKNAAELEALSSIA
jgi:hypothetical protein